MRRFGGYPKHEVVEAQTYAQEAARRDAEPLGKDRLVKDERTEIRGGREYKVTVLPDDPMLQPEAREMKRRDIAGWMERLSIPVGGYIGDRRLREPEDTYKGLE